MKAKKTFRRSGVVALLAIAVLECALATFQWIELWRVRSGAESVCAINATFNCETVWNSDFATFVHEHIGMPIAGLGLAWGLALVFLTVVTLRRERAKKDFEVPVSALEILTSIGFIGCVFFAGYSYHVGAWCVTCLGTYALVAAAYFVRVQYVPSKLHKNAWEEWLWALGPLFAAYVVLLIPGLNTASSTLKEAIPSASTSERPLPDGHGAEAISTNQNTGAPVSSDELSQFLSRLTPEMQQQLSNMLAAYEAKAPATPHLTRERHGPSDAPVRVVEWTDILCPHCRMLVQAMKQMEGSLPAGRISIEARQFPLDAECNPLLKRSDGSHTRCVAAKAQICLEGAPDYWTLREQMFAEQDHLDPDRVVEIASSGSVSKEKMKACIDSPETAAKLKDDIDYAAQLNPTGTPIVLLNGKEATPQPGLLYALTLTGGRVDVPALSSLPPPRSQL